MVLRKLVGIVMITLLVGVASLASAGVPDLLLSTSARTDGSAPAVVFNLPDGTGAGFFEAVNANTFAPIDATITLTLLDGDGLPVVDFPFEDVVLVNAYDDPADPGLGGMMACTGGATPDRNSDELGTTVWSNPLTAAGYSPNLTVIMVSNAPLESSAGEAISFNSTDVNGDFIVDLLDVVKFSQDFGAGTDPFRSDFEYDGVVDLLDVILMAQTQGRGCAAR